VKRKVGGRTQRAAFLIVCEGTRTEPNYFEALRTAFKLQSVEIDGTGKNTASLVKYAIERSDGRDQVWCVFDRDSFPPQNFNTAIQQARDAGLKVAYSNEAFEIWYLLHFDFHTSALSRTLYAEKLTERLGRPYKKNDPSLFEVLRPRQDQAIRFARKLLASYSNHNPEKDNPSTTVHVLVEELRKLAPAGT
jgi:RloB-like protein